MRANRRQGAPRVHRVGPQSDDLTAKRVSLWAYSCDCGRCGACAHESATPVRLSPSGMSRAFAWWCKLTAYSPTRAHPIVRSQFHRRMSAVPAIYARCEAPPVSLAGEYEIEYAPFGDSRATSNSKAQAVSFLYYDALYESVVPRAAPLVGGTRFTIVGANLAQFGVGTRTGARSVAYLATLRRPESHCAPSLTAAASLAAGRSLIAILTAILTSTTAGGRARIARQTQVRPTSMASLLRSVSTMRCPSASSDGATARSAPTSRLASRWWRTGRRRTA